MIDVENLTLKVSKDIDHLQSRYHLSHQETTDILLSLGIESYLKDLSTRELNGSKAPYLADWHLRQGLKYYEQDMGRG